MSNNEVHQNDKKITYNLPKQKESHSSFRDNPDLDDREAEVRIERPSRPVKIDKEDTAVDEILGKAKNVLSKVKHKVMKDGNADLKKYYFKYPFNPSDFALS